MLNSDVALMFVSKTSTEWVWAAEGLHLACSPLQQSHLRFLSQFFSVAAAQVDDVNFLREAGGSTARTAW